MAETSWKSYIYNMKWFHIWHFTASPLPFLTMLSRSNSSSQEGEVNVWSDMQFQLKRHLINKSIKLLSNLILFHGATSQFWTHKREDLRPPSIFLLLFFSCKIVPCRILPGALIKQFLAISRTDSLLSLKNQGTDECFQSSGMSPFGKHFIHRFF